VADLEGRSGIHAQAGGKHVGLGTHNALLALGPQTYLEIIGPDPDQPEPPVPRPFGIGDITRGQLVGWALACDDIDQAVAEARSHGYDPGEVVDGCRVGPAGTVLRWRGGGRCAGRRACPFSHLLGQHRTPRQISTTQADPRIHPD
jgi:Glyoxalase-like domain